MKKHQQSPVEVTTAGGAGVIDLKDRCQPVFFYLPSPSALCLYSFYSSNNSRAMLAIDARARRISKKVSIGVNPPYIYISAPPDLASARAANLPLDAHRC